MTRLNIVVEGQAEETFVREILYHHLIKYQVFATPRMVFNSRASRGGVSTYQKIHLDVSLWCKQDQGAFVSSFFDLYALPGDFPSREKASRETDVYAKIAVLEAAFAGSISKPNFIPYLQLHEYEALILSEPNKLGVYYPHHAGPINALAAEIAGAPTPEHVNEGRQTAPSKRILRHIPGYKKNIGGALVAMEIGLPMIRSRCRHFDQWVTTLENLKSA